jgi:uncharacterized protein (TIGR03790 family)
MPRLVYCWAIAFLFPVAAFSTTITFGAFPEEAPTPVSAANLPHPLTATQLAVIINTADTLSVAIGNYYVQKRHIPKVNVIRLSFNHDQDVMSVEEFAKVRKIVDLRTDEQVQAYALTWTRPYRVGCMAITAAFAFGANEKYCATGCKPTQLSPYFNASTLRPFADLHVRPAMIIAALDLEHAKELIDRGVRADGTAPRGTAYLVQTDDRPRNVRASEYSQAAAALSHSIDIRILQAPAIENRPDVMFYFIGSAAVPALGTNRFLPGAVADHLTSFAGMLTDSPQMSSLRWLEAGATGSYGTVVEPCNLLGKFPYVPVLMAHYLAGETLVEAYWKSVAMPGQGLFIGEPLAAPFRKP